MNLWGRLLLLLLTAFRRGPMDPTRDPSVLRFRVWPHDLDTSLHMNNGRYWTLMDLGRADLLLRTGLWRHVLKEKWTPVVSAAKIRFRREMRLWQPFRIETRVVTWGEDFVVMEQRVLRPGRGGADILSAVALLRVGLYDRAAKHFVPSSVLLGSIGISAASSEPSPEVEAFLKAEDALKHAA